MHESFEKSSLCNQFKQNNLLIEGSVFFRVQVRKMSVLSMRIPTHLQMYLNQDKILVTAKEINKFYGEISVSQFVYENPFLCMAFS